MTEAPQLIKENTHLLASKQLTDLLMLIIDLLLVTLNNSSSNRVMDKSLILYSKYFTSLLIKTFLNFQRQPMVNNR